LICGVTPSLLAGEEDPGLVIGGRVVAAVALVGENARGGVADQRLHVRDPGCCGHHRDYRAAPSHG
jgi:hypothetical protein